MNAKAMLPADHQDYAIRIARIELALVLARIERWQSDVSIGRLPPADELDRAEKHIRKTLEEIGW